MTQNTLKTLKNAIEIDTKKNRRTEKIVASNQEMGSEVKKSVGRLELVHVSRNIRRAAAALPATALREGTTGRPLAPRLHLVPRIMAVADTAPAVVHKQPSKPQPNPELAFYRKYTEAMLRRYTRISMQPGRTPALLGRELFQGDADHTTLTTFEDGVVFCIDIERCLLKLRKDDQRLIKRIAIQGYTHEEAAPLLGITFKTCVVNYNKALDRVTEIFLAARLMSPQNCCQAPETVEN